MSFNHHEIEPKMAKNFGQTIIHLKLQKIKERKNFYALDMFPYPSGQGLHVGHPEGYTATDVVSRMKRAPRV